MNRNARPNQQSALPDWITEDLLISQRKLLETFFRTRGELSPDLSAEDLASETQLRYLYHQRLPRRAPRSPAADLLATASEVWRAMSRAHFPPNTAPPGVGAQATYDELDELRALFWEARLTSRQRRFLCYRLQGWSNMDIAEVTSIVPAIIAQDVHGAVLHLRSSRERLSAKLPTGRVDWQTITKMIRESPRKASSSPGPRARL